MAQPSFRDDAYDVVNAREREISSAVVLTTIHNAVGTALSRPQEIPHSHMGLRQAVSFERPRLTYVEAPSILGGQ